MDNQLTEINWEDGHWYNRMLVLLQLIVKHELDRQLTKSQANKMTTLVAAMTNLKHNGEQRQHFRTIYKFSMNLQHSQMLCFSSWLDQLYVWLIKM